MMRALLADRFKMASHYEPRQVPVLALLLVKPGKTGPQLRAHPDDASCTATPQAPVTGGYPPLCGGLFQMAATVSGRVRGGARNVTMAFIANLLSGLGSLGRPVLDQTGLNGAFDFALEWAPEPNTPVPLSLGPDFTPDVTGPSFIEALKEQLGLKLESQKGPTDTLVIDHIEHPSVN